MTQRKYNIEKMHQENLVRNLRFSHPYNPLTGEGSTAIPRVMVTIKDYTAKATPMTLWLPEDMLKEEDGVRDLLRAGSFRRFIAERDNTLLNEVLQEAIDTEFIEFCKIRMEYDFEYWAYTTVMIKDKVTGQDIPFALNYAQRAILLKAFEDQRRADLPIRVILLKARQWGGSTLTQIYMLWIQMIHKTGWNSVIAAHKKNGSRTIKGMVNKAIKYYPEFLGQYDFARWENSNSTSIINGRNNKITIGTAQVPDSVRSEDIVMAHLSEVAYWQAAEMIKPEDLIASIVGSIIRVPYSLVVMESTANGTGNFFHREWLAAEKKESDKTPVFVAWWQIELYREKVKDEDALVQSWDDYQWELWDMGATMEAIAWWMSKKKELRSAGLNKMKAEYPSTATEAFVSTGRAVFSPALCRKMRESCKEPIVIGELAAEGTEGKECKLNLRFVPDTTGHLKIWQKPETELLISNRYLVVVDVGGRSERSDYSVICVIDRSLRMGGGPDEVIAEWHGHIDHDLLCWKAVQIAAWYQNALLVIEANTLESTFDTDGDHTQFILEKISNVYSNLYARDDPDKVRMGVPLRYGFHTNRATKTAVIDNEILMYRTQGYVEHCDEAVDEHERYEKLQNGSYAAQEGYHDDRLMTRAIGMYISENMPMPIVRPVYDRHAMYHMVGMSTM
jgi:hypothetical protein